MEKFNGKALYFSRNLKRPCQGIDSSLARSSKQQKTIFFLNT
jgi:hypothetical protein